MQPKRVTLNLIIKIRQRRIGKLTFLHFRNDHFLVCYLRYVRNTTICRFFTYVNDDVFNTPTFQSYYKLKRQFNPDLTQPEIVTQEKTMNIETFLDLAMNATVFNIMWQFLIEKSKK